ncbi:nitroreductase family protein [Actinomadura sp. 1N219]|uniref:nitroreductase family protein n=1 Tax=Actinomadura sp. 1N219 TaxID=3375152 RepID=UPI003788A009
MDSAAAVFHELTSHSPARHPLVPNPDPRVRQDFLPGWPEHRPRRFKTYGPDAARVALPAGPDGEPGLPALAGLLRSALGTRALPGRPAAYRAAASAGNRHPIEAYVCARGLDGLPDGAWHYRPDEHSLVQVAPGEVCDGTAVVLTGVPWRSCWKYAERGYRHVWWDAGTVLAQFLAAASALGLPVTSLVSFPDRTVAGVVGAEPPHELPLVVAGFGDPSPRVPPEAPLSGDLGPHPVEFPLVAATHLAADLGSASAASAWSERTGADFADGALAPWIACRRTVRGFRPDVPVGRADLAAVLDAAALPLRWDAGDLLPDLRVCVQAVSGVPGGLYRWRDGDLHAEGTEVTREQAQRLCLGQRQAGDAAFVVLCTTRLASRLRERGERAYRALQLSAGVALGRVNLAAGSRGLGSCGLAFDDELLAALSPDAPDGLTAVAVGVPR